MDKANDDLGSHGDRSPNRVSYVIVRAIAGGSVGHDPTMCTGWRNQEICVVVVGEGRFSMDEMRTMEGTRHCTVMV